jgi:hypothetical protein
MSEVTKLGDFTNNGKMLSHMDSLKSAIKDIENKNMSPDKILILSLDNKNGDYNISFHQAGMTMSECLALCDVAKSIMLSEMGY